MTSSFRGKTLDTRGGYSRERGGRDKDVLPQKREVLLSSTKKQRGGAFGRMKKGGGRRPSPEPRRNWKPSRPQKGYEREKKGK